MEGYSKLFGLTPNLFKILKTNTLSLEDSMNCIKDSSFTESCKLIMVLNLYLRFIILK